MYQSVSLAQKRERLRELEQQAQQLPRFDATRASCALLLAELRWERQEIHDVEQEVAALARPV